MIVRNLTPLLGFCLLCACIGAPEVSRPEELDPRLTPTARIEQGKLVALVAGTRTTRVRHERAYMPLEVAVVNKGLSGLTVNLESFILIDEDGARYPAVEYGELASSYRNVEADRRMAETPSVLASQFAGYREVPSALTRMRLDQPVPRELFLRKFEYAVDFLYFPRPKTGVRGRKFELFMSAPELEDPVFVSFEVAE